MHERYAVWHELAIENSADIRQATSLDERSVMTGDKERFEKVLAVAINPGAYEGEAIAALRKARELAKRNPSLANAAPSPGLPLPARTEPEYSIRLRVRNIPFDWFKVCINSLSAEAYGLGLKSKLYCDLSEVPTALDVSCDGSHEACEAFRVHLDALIDYVSGQSRAATETTAG